jgi:predicted RNase H-like HicB family nuclease
MPEMLTQLTVQFPILAIIGGVLTVVVYIVTRIKKAVKVAHPWFKKLTHLVEDLVGEEARPGVDARPGLMVRTQTIEKRLDGITEAQAAIIKTQADHDEVLKELRPNHGGSIKDRIRDLHQDGNTSKSRLDKLEGALEMHLATCTPGQPVNVVTTTTVPS